MYYKSKYPGSIGEVFQGKIGGRDLLLSFPCDVYTEVTLKEEKREELEINNKKCYEFLENILKLWGYEKLYKNFTIDIKSNIPRGKGFASSTADICALYNCLLKCFNRDFSVEELIKLAIAIEPTDSIVFEKATLFQYKKGDFLLELGNYMELYIMVYEGKKSINTVQFNEQSIEDLAHLDYLEKDLIKAFHEKDIKALAKISTESIIKNQKRLYYDILDEVIKISKDTEGVGILGAHSGDMLGIIYESEEKMIKALNLNIKVKDYRCYGIKTLKSIDTYRKRR
ncbi:kinase [Clostridium sp. MSJ-4]|uniref:Kinase n=1 Tax=Clostridium simiarum TaxID=2841506 RepID=A0ABS6EWG1_9CLOT|nr:kinase [Clostridium simiarum]MBU5590567.1 kinase [Clostridium simiarum]